MAHIYNITGTVGETLTINFSNIFNDYTSNFVAGVIGLNQLYQNFPTSWGYISDSEDVSSLAYPFNIMSGNVSFTPYLINGTDYLKEIILTPQTIGVYTFYFREFGNVNIPNVYPLSQTTGKIILTVNEQIPPTPETPNIPQGVQYNTYDRVIKVKKNTPTQLSFGIDGLYTNNELIDITSTLPYWITNNELNNYTQFWNINAPTVNTYNYYANVYRIRKYFNGVTWVYSSPFFLGTATITVIVVDELYEIIDNCCSDENINIVWLNRQGGRGNYIFSQRKDFNVEVGKKNNYIKNDIKKYSEIKNVYNGMKVYATGLTLNQIDFLDTLRYSIQAWVYVNQIFIPIFLDIDSFEKYNTKENMYEISLSFIFAEQLNIQRQ